MNRPDSPASILATLSLADGIRRTLGPSVAFILLVALAPTPPALCEPQMHSAEVAWIALVRGNPESAAEQVRGLLRREPDEARAAYCLAEALHRLDRKEEAIVFFRERASSRPASGIGELGLGTIELEEKNFVASDSLLQKALEHFTRNGNRQGEVVAREQLGRVFLRLNRWEEAAESFETALDLAETLELPVAVASLHGGLGQALKDVSRREGNVRLDEAVQHLHQAIQQTRDLDLPLWEGRAQLTLSIISRWRQDLDGSLDLRIAALRNFEEAGDTAGQADCWQRIGAIHLMQGRLTKALRPFQTAWELAEKAEESHLIGYSVMSLGSINYFAGDYVRAIELYREAHRVAHETEDKDLEAASLVNWGIVLIAEEEHLQATETFDQARRICIETGDRRGEIRCLSNLGLCLYRMNHLDEAIARLEEALNACGEIGDVDIQRAYLQRDIGLCRLAQKQWKLAEEAFDLASRAAEAMNLPTILEDVNSSRADIARAQNRPEEALRYLNAAMATREGLRARVAGASDPGSSFLGRGEIIYENAVDLLYEMHLTNRSSGLDRKAFDVAQRGKARSFLDLLAETEADLRSRADPDYQRREREILGRVAELLGRSTENRTEDGVSVEVEITRLENELEILEEEIRTADPRYADLRYPRPCATEDVQGAVLEDGELLLDYLLGEEASYVWAVTTGSFRIARLPPRDAIEEAVQRYLPLLQDYNLLGSDPAYFIAAAADLYRMLLEPVERELESARAVIVVPHGILHYLPFETVPLKRPRGEDAPSDFATVPYLVLHADVSYLPSVSGLARLRTLRKARGGGSARSKEPSVKQLLVVGNPAVVEDTDLSVFARVATGGDPTPLPFGKEEIEGIRSLFTSEQTVVLDGRDATLSKVEQATAGGCRLVHFAAHGVFNERRPQYSGLVLTPDSGTGDDGFLSVGKVFGLSTECDQVTLSACSTALGKNMTGEGLVGLTRAFMYSGAQSVVAALWEVSDEATSTFMRDFYSNIRAGPGIDRAHALAEAKRNMIRRPAGAIGEGLEPAHPFFWAAFVMTGDGRSL